MTVTGPVRLFAFYGETDTLLMFTGDSMGSPIDLSKATRLRDVHFDGGDLNAHWIIMALQTITSRHRDLRRITLYVCGYTFSDAGAHVRDMFGETLYKQWLDLDRLLLQLWELHSVRPKVTYGVVPENHEKDVIDCVSYLLPETTKKGIVDLANHRG